MTNDKGPSLNDGGMSVGNDYLEHGDETSTGDYVRISGRNKKGYNGTFNVDSASDFSFTRTVETNDYPRAESCRIGRGQDVMIVTTGALDL